jgi:hypothetical protein
MCLADAILLEAYRDPKDIWIAFRTDGNAGSGTENDPYDGSTQERFDGLMRRFNQEMLEYTVLHLGPGVFETKGTAPYDSNQGWEMRPGWKIIGSGIDVTIVKLVGAVDQGGLIVAIGHKDFNTVADYTEVCDLTVDCNLPVSQPYPIVAMAAVALKGNHVHVHRVRAIHFGTHQHGSGENAPECFVIAVGGRAAFLPEPTDCVIEDCIVEHRASIGGSSNITCLIISSGETAGDGVMEHPRGGLIRSCFVDGLWRSAKLSRVCSDKLSQRLEAEGAASSFQGVEFSE